MLKRLQILNRTIACDMWIDHENSLACIYFSIHVWPKCKINTAYHFILKFACQKLLQKHYGRHTLWHSGLRPVVKCHVPGIHLQLCFQSSFRLLCLGTSRQWLKSLPHPCGRPRWNSCILTTVWPSPSCYSLLGSDPEDEKGISFSLSITAFQISIFLSFIEIHIMKKKMHGFQTLLHQSKHLFISFCPTFFGVSMSANTLIRGWVEENQTESEKSVEKPTSSQHLSPWQETLHGWTSSMTSQFLLS